MNYGELKTLLASYLHRDDLTDQIPTFITLAQSRMNHDVDLTSLQSKDCVFVVKGQVEADLPTDFLEMLSLRIPFNGGFRLLQQKSLAQNSQVYETASGATGSPLYYARYGNSIELSPTPDASTTLEIVYKQRLAALVNDTDTDELLTNHLNIYIYGAMLEASPFLMDDKRAQVWGGLYENEVKRINDFAEDAEWSGSPMQITNLGTDTP